MHRVWAIIERDLRRFRRSPVLVIVSIIMPLVQLVVLGYAFGGKIQNLKVGVVDEDHGVPAIKLHEMFQAVAANAKTFTPIYYSDRGDAMRDLRNGKIQGVHGHPAGLFAQGSGRRESTHRACRGQHGPVFIVGAGRRADRPARQPTIRRRFRRARRRMRRWTSSRFILMCRISSICCRASSCWRFLSRR